MQYLFGLCSSSIGLDSELLGAFKWTQLKTLFSEETLSFLLCMTHLYLIEGSLFTCFVSVPFQLTMALNYNFFKLRRIEKEAQHFWLTGLAIYARGLCVCKDTPLWFLFTSLQIEDGFIKSRSIYKIIAFKNIH